MLTLDCVEQKTFIVFTTLTHLVFAAQTLHASILRRRMAGIQIHWTSWAKEAWMAASTQLMETQMSKLTKTQYAVLEHAVQHQAGALLPLPKVLKLNGAATNKVLQSLIKRGFAEELSALSWQNNNGERTALFITDAGRYAISPVTDRAASKTATQTALKKDILLQLLLRENGATLDELMAASQWQAHSVRGFLSGTVKKKLGLLLTSNLTNDGIRQYRIANQIEQVSV